VSGQEITDYSSDRDFRVEDRTSPSGKAEKLCAIFDASHAAQTVAAILSSTTYGLAHERHRALVDALSLSEFAVGQGFRYLECCQWLKIT
jgi:hypothetical protein